jgi:hypothetical protein
MSQEVEVKIKVDTAKAVTDVNKLGDAFDNTAQDAQDAQKVFSKAGNGVEVEQSIAGLKQLKRELKNTAVGSAEFKKLYNDIDDLEDKLKSAKNTSSDWVDSLEQAGGPLGMVGAAINKAKVATQSFGGALKATGIGLIVSLLGGLAVAFSDNEGAMKKIQPLLDGIGKIFQGVFRAVEPLFNTLVDLAINALPMVSKAFAVVYSSVTSVFQSLGKIGGAIGKLISGDFSGAWQDAKSSVNDFGKNYDASIKRFNEGTKEITKVEKKESKTRVKIKKETNDELDKLEQERLAKQMASAEEAMNKEKQLREAQETPAEREEREYQEWLAIYQANNLNTELLDKEHKDNLALIAKEKADKQKETDDKAKEEQKEKDQKALDDKMLGFQLEMENETVSFDTKREVNLEREKLLLEDATLTENQRTEIKNNAKNVALQIDAEEVQSVKAREEAKQILLQAGFDALTSLTSIMFGEGKKAQAISKGLTLAQIGIDTASAFSKLMAGSEAAAVATGPAYPLAKPIFYASGVVQILSNVARAKKALSGSTSGGGGGGGISTPASIATPASAQPSINVVGASKTNAIAETIAQQGQQPIKAFVVANDVTTQQGLDRAIVSSASIG